MSERDDRDETPVAQERTPEGKTASETEPDWAAEIHRLRRARGNRLRQVFSTFDDEQEER